MANTQVPVKLQLPPAPPGFLNSPKQPESTDQITSQYLSDLRVYLQRLKNFHKSDHGVVGVEMITEIELHKAWVTRYLLNKAQPQEQVTTPPANLAPIDPTVPTIDIRTILANGFRDVNKKLDGLTTDVKKLQADGVTTNKKLDDLTTDVKKLQADGVATNKKLDGLTTDVKKLQADGVTTSEKLDRLTADGVATNKKLDDLTTDVKKLQADGVTTSEKLDRLTADGVATNTKLDGLGTDVKKLQAHNVTTNEKLDRLTANGVATAKKLDELAQKLRDEVDALKTTLNTATANITTLNRGVRDNGVSLTDLDKKVTDLPQTEGFKQAISASIRENEAILDIRETLRNLDQASTNASEKLTRLQRGLARVDRVQCQLFNATRANNESWLAISNEDGVLPSEQGLVVVQSRDQLNRLNNRDIAELLGFYGCIPSDFHPADTPAVRKSNFVRQSRTWSSEVQHVHLGTLSNIFTLPITSFSSSLPPPN